MMLFVADLHDTEAQGRHKRGFGAAIAHIAVLVKYGVHFTFR